jgi:hypothetical protein
MVMVMLILLQANDILLTTMGMIQALTNLLFFTGSNTSPGKSPQ